MSVAAYLLGAPVVVRDGTVYAAPKGRKAWALLAYLALSDRPPTRQQLVDLLFPDAEDPAGALRWNLSELRRLLGERRRLAGLGEAVLREGALRALASGNARTAVDLATRLVAAAPLDEDAHALLIRAFAGTGDAI